MVRTKAWSYMVIPWLETILVYLFFPASRFSWARVKTRKTWRNQGTHWSQTSLRTLGSQAQWPKRISGEKQIFSHYYLMVYFVKIKILAIIFPIFDKFDLFWKFVWVHNALKANNVPLWIFLPLAKGTIQCCRLREMWKILYFQKSFAKATTFFERSV